MTRRINGDALENRAGTAATGDVFTFNDAHADGGQWQPPGAGSAAAAWPVGSIFLSAVSTNPATLLGFGTWSAIGAGRVLIGIDAGDADFDTLGETGGSKTPGHSHGAGTLVTDTHGGHTHGAGTLAPSAHSGTAVDAHSGTAVSAHSGTAVDAHSGTAVSAHASHTHSSGTLSVTDPATGTSHHTLRHEHPMTQVYQHSHNIAAGQGSHQHGMAEGQTDGAGTFMDRSSAASATTAVTDLATLPQMVTDNTGSATARTDGPMDPGTSNAWDASHSVGGSTGNESASLTHSVTQPANHVVTQPANHVVTQPANHVVTQPSAHTMSGATATDGGHLHALGGSTAVQNPSVVQPYLVVAMWQRTA